MAVMKVNGCRLRSNIALCVEAPEAVVRSKPISLTSLSHIILPLILSLYFFIFRYQTPYTLNTTSADPEVNVPVMYLISTAHKGIIKYFYKLKEKIQRGPRTEQVS
jgi:hypothetical protein